MNKQLTYDEFKEVFPDVRECMRFLAKLKWDQGFACRKCGNEKYFEGQGLFARRCTRCGYNETPSTASLFHGCKFPIEKAFYILYIVIMKDKSTLAELSEKIGVRRNTILNFKKKIAAWMEENPGDLSAFFADLDTQRI